MTIQNFVQNPDFHLFFIFSLHDLTGIYTLYHNVKFQSKKIQFIVKTAYYMFIKCIFHSFLVCSERRFKTE